jgi:hypothetical protein
MNRKQKHLQPGDRHPSGTIPEPAVPLHAWLGRHLYRQGKGRVHTVRRIVLNEGRPKRYAAAAERRIMAPMSKPRVTFKYKRIAEDDWQIEAHYPGAEIRYIKGLKSKAETDEWLQGTLRIDWLRSQGYAK